MNMTIINIMCGLCMLTRKHRHRHGHGKKMLQVERQDGKTLEFAAPILVEELLKQFPGAESVGLSDNHHLPLTYKLKLGRMYHLLPKTSTTTTTTTQVELKDESTKRRRIKVVITKQQLQQLVSNQLSLQDLLMVQKTPEIETAAANKHNYPCKCWKPELQSIPEDQGDE